MQARQKELYEKRLAQYLEESNGMSALEKHVFMFMDKDKTFSPKTVAAGLNEMHGKGASIKGAVISGFNATHGGSNQFCPAAEKLFANNLHLGTTRVWNPDGSVNEARYKKLLDYIAEKQGGDSSVLAYSTLTTYLNECFREDKPEPLTGRKADTFFSSANVQKIAAIKAWDEVFDRLTSGWKINDDGQLDACIAIDDVRLFFVNSPVVFLKAACGLLPIEKPTRPAKVAPAPLR